MSKLKGNRLSDTLKMSFRNRRSLSSERIASDVAETIFAQHISIWAMAETHLRGEEKAEMNGYKFFNSGLSMSASKTQAGVGLAYDPGEVKVIDFTAVSERNAVAWLIAKDTRWQVVATYAPTENCDELEYLRYLEELKDACKLRSSKVKSWSEFQLLIFGDLNATLGKKCMSIYPSRFEDSFLKKRVAGMVNSWLKWSAKESFVSIINSSRKLKLRKWAGGIQEQENSHWRTIV